MTITPEDHKLLRHPFAAEAVKFRIDGKPAYGKVRILTYIDSRLVAERLSEVDPDWSGYPEFVRGDGDAISLRFGLPVVYHLTVKGRNRADVGQIGPALFGPQKGEFVADDKHAKMSVSDALKRSAVLFGVGAYLYTLGNVKIDVGLHTSKGEGKFLNDAGRAHLKKQYSEFISRPAFVERFGLPISYGDELREATVIQDHSTSENTETSENTDRPPQDKQDTPPEVDTDDPYTPVIEGIFELLGRSPEAGKVWLSGRANKKLAIKKTLKQAVEKGADTGKLDSLLADNGLHELTTK